MCKLLLPRCTFHTFLKNVCFLFTRSRKRMKPKLHCVSAFCRQWGRGLLESVSSCAMCSVPSQLFLLKFLLFPVSIYVLTIKKAPCAFISSVTVGILTKDFGSRHGSTECPATSCYQWLHNVRKRRHFRLLEKLKRSHPPSMGPRRQAD